MRHAALGIVPVNAHHVAINRWRAHARNTYKLPVNHSVNEREAFAVSSSNAEVVSAITDSRNIWSSPTRRSATNGESPAPSGA